MPPDQKRDVLRERNQARCVRPEAADVLVIGAGPAGSCAARAAALGGAGVLLVEKRQQVGLPVQCAEFVPWQLAHRVSIPARCIAQPIGHMRTVLPDGRLVVKPAAGYVIDRALWDKHLAVAACLAGAKLRVGWTAVGWDGHEVLLRRGRQEARIRATVIVGADGPHSTVGRWIDQRQTEFVQGVEVEVALSERRDYTEIYFEPSYRGGYAWLFPKGETANVGVAVNPRMGGRAGEALEHFLNRLGLSHGSVVGHLGGVVPVGGPVRCLHLGNILLAGDAAGLTHPVTGGGIAPAVISGQIAGEAAAQAVASRSLAALAEYPRAWEEMMGASQRQALINRRYLDANWSEDPGVLGAAVEETWIAFPAYGRRKPHSDKEVPEQ